jgi:hypothetical protein
MCHNTIVKQIYLAFCLLSIVALSNKGINDEKIALCPYIPCGNKLKLSAPFTFALTWIDII